jgi:hypothetical protein
MTDRAISINPRIKFIPGNVGDFCIVECLIFESRRAKIPARFQRTTAKSRGTSRAKSNRFAFGSQANGSVPKANTA